MHLNVIILYFLSFSMEIIQQPRLYVLQPTARIQNETYVTHAVDDGGFRLAVNYERPLFTLHYNNTLVIADNVNTALVRTERPAKYTVIECEMYSFKERRTTVG